MNSTYETMEGMVTTILEKHKEWDRETLQRAYDELGKVVLSPEIMALPYQVRNKPFMTASKIKSFNRCEFCYYKKYVELMEDPTCKDKDYLVIGQAVDDYLTHGIEFFRKKYVTMTSRVSDVAGAIAEQEEKLAASLKKVNKDGSRSKAGENEEIACKEKIAQLRNLDGKIQITQTMLDLVMGMAEEFDKNEMFAKNPQKHVFFHVFAGFLIKVELDDYREKENLINDVKTVSSVLDVDGTWPATYEDQAAMYEWIVEENKEATPEVRLEIVDKYEYFARSAGVKYRHETLMPVRGRLITSLERMAQAHETGFFAEPPDQALKYRCPFYGLEGHGRPTEFIIY